MSEPIYTINASEWELVKQTHKLVEVLDADGKIIDYEHVRIGDRVTFVGTPIEQPADRT